MTLDGFRHANAQVSNVLGRCQQEYYGDKNEHTVSTVSGVTPLVGTDSRFWVTEIMLEVIRCEQICFGPRFSLPS